MSYVMPIPAPNHEHTWEPLSGWSGRYRCPGCSCFGYKARLVTRATGKPGEIRPYACDTKVNGEPCPHPAVTKEFKLRHDKRSGYKVWKCADHRKAA